MTILLIGAGRNQASNPGYITLAALGIPLVSSPPGDDHKQFAPRLGFAWSPGAALTQVASRPFP